MTERDALRKQLAKTEARLERCLLAVKEYKEAKTAGRKEAGAGVYRGPTEESGCDHIRKKIRELQEKLDALGEQTAAAASEGAASVGSVIKEKIESKAKIPLPAGAHIDPEDGRIKGGAKIGNKYFGAEITYSGGAAPGADPRGPIVDLHTKTTWRIGPVKWTRTRTTKASISPEVQENVSSGMGGKGSTPQRDWFRGVKGDKNPEDP